jgi:chromosomal replication initiation ATPase DnaA
MSLCEERTQDITAARLAAHVTGFGLGVEPGVILDSVRGSAEVSFARHVAMYLCHVGFELSLARVAAAFGRDRSTVAHSCHLVEDRRDDPRFDALIASLESMLQAAPSPPHSGDKA